MFVIHEGRLLIAPVNSPQSHRQWFTSIGLQADEVVRDSVRGFIDDRGIFFYRGEDFLVDEEAEKEFIQYLKEIRDSLELKDDTEVYGGVTPTDDVRYPPRKSYGTVAELMKD